MGKPLYYLSPGNRGFSRSTGRRRGWITQPAPALSGITNGPDYARLLHSDEVAHLPYGVSDPTGTLYSSTRHERDLAVQ